MSGSLFKGHVGILHSSEANFSVRVPLWVFFDFGILYRLTRQGCMNSVHVCIRVSGFFSETRDLIFSSAPIFREKPGFPHFRSKVPNTVQTLSKKTNFGLVRVFQ